MSAANRTIAAIDVGTNTILMVVGRKHLSSPKAIEILDDTHAIARLGEGVDSSQRINSDAIERVCNHLKNCRERAIELGSNVIRAFGTSALRDATNKQNFITAVKRNTGVDLVELSGSEEAQFTFSGAGFGLSTPEEYAVIDIGGGSTELAFGSILSGSIYQSKSVDVGAVRITERCFSSLPPTLTQINEASSIIDDVLSGLFPIPPEIQLIGVAGTVTTLGALDLQVENFRDEKLNGHRISREKVCVLCNNLLAKSYDEIEGLPQVSSQRADIITAGALILQRFLEKFDIPELSVSTKGIRYGLLQHMLTITPNIITGSKPFPT